MSYTFRSTNSDRTINETAITAEQALDLRRQPGIAYSPRDERILIDDNGTTIYHASASPQQLDGAA